MPRRFRAPKIHRPRCSWSRPPGRLLAALVTLVAALLAAASAQVVYGVTVTQQVGNSALPIGVDAVFGAGDRLRLEIAVEVGPTFDVAADDLIILLPVPEATAPSGGVTSGFATSWLDDGFRVVQADLASFVNWSNLEPITAGERVSLVVFFDVVQADLGLAQRLLDLPGRVQVGSASNAFEEATLVESAAAAPPAPAEVPGQDEVTAMQLFRVCSQIGFETARLRCFDAAAEALGFEVVQEEAGP